MTPITDPGIPGEPAVEVRDLRRSYGDYEAVRGISFSVARGELFALLGTNGAGKTTTLEVLEGYSPPSSGTVRVLGLDPYTQGALVRRRTGVMLQEGGFFKELTVRETVDSWRSFISGAQPAAQVLDRVGLTERAGTRVAQLSGGERRRLDLALAVLNTPELLFLDEPTTGMDPEARRATWRLVTELRAAGTTVLLTTHYLEEAQQLADRVAIMDRGQLAAVGTVEEVLSGHGTRITFPLPAGLNSSQLPPVLGELPTVTDGTVLYTVARTAPALAALHTWAAELDVELDGIEARNASLEDVFLELAHEKAETR
ncbi:MULTISPECIES: ABC transporter ATP-binding protein [unclassified Kitasatospora]|uniref:ABC transporter ATP-binding protein n=1 Tax=unclassified Kitasatospora TaxID=2633591 RepID=UPI00070D4A92|nr:MULTISPECIES: ABC transporter ATP-binding protein [unclassified Kitasatospora]KQV18813.1 multidrug ABC transporter ATP-binding protein [Kitasatospora sp. Root107]KRB74794.1 multidrug ABC transporter ATP-binding protein [Kitasatospora sp. Root187]